MFRAILAILINFYLDGEKMFKGGGCVLYILLIGSAFIMKGIDKITETMSNQGKITVYSILLVLLIAFAIWFWRFCKKH